MSEFIGVKKLSDFQVNPSFKKDALIFDRIAIFGVGHFIRMIIEGFRRDQIDHYCQELYWLLENGIVFQPDFTVQEAEAFNNSNFELMLRLREPYELRAQQEGRAISTRGLVSDFWNYWETFNDYQTRSLAVLLRQEHKLDAYPISNATYLKRNQPKNEASG